MGFLSFLLIFEGLLIVAYLSYLMGEYYDHKKR